MYRYTHCFACVCVIRREYTVIFVCTCVCVCVRVCACVTLIERERERVMKTVFIQGHSRNLTPHHPQRIHSV